MSNDPIRLIDDPSVVSGLRADLVEAASAGLEGFDVAAGAAGLQAAIAAEVTGATAVSSGAAKAGAGWFGKAVIGAVLIGGGVAAWLATRSEPEASPPTARVVAAAEDDETSKTSSKGPAVELETEPKVPVLVPESPAPPSHVEEAPKPAAVDAAPVLRARHAPKAGSKPAKPKADDYVREARLVADARKALRTDPRRALALLKDAKRSFPRGMLAEEREALTIIALAELGKVEDASRRGERFLKKHGKGPYAEAVRAAFD
ncbi:MAG: hypothetical protein AAGA54_29980 [Myxococcota bacterium]